jgi:hypothetical protein
MFRYNIQCSCYTNISFLRFTRCLNIPYENSDSQDVWLLHSLLKSLLRDNCPIQAAATLPPGKVLLASTFFRQPAFLKSFLDFAIQIRACLATPAYKELICLFVLQFKVQNGSLSVMPSSSYEADPLPRGLRRRSASDRMLGLRFQISPGACMFYLVNIVCCTEEVSTTCRSLVKGNPT